MPTPSRTWNSSYEADPPQTQDIGEGDDRMRENRTDVRQRTDPEHHFQTTTAEAFAGEHRMGSARICVGTSTDRGNMQIDLTRGATDILPGLAGHQGGITDTVKINNPFGLYFYETDTGLLYYNDGVTGTDGWVLVALGGDYANDLTNIGEHAVLTLPTNFRTAAVSAFLVTDPDTAGLRLNVRRGLYIDPDGTVQEYAGIADQLINSITGAVGSPATNPRIDLLYMDGATLTLLEGTEAASPTAPSVPPGAFPLALLYRRVGESAFTVADVAGEAYLYRDLRNLIAMPRRANSITLYEDDSTGNEGVGNGTETVRVSATHTPAKGTRRLSIELIGQWELTRSGGSINGTATARLYVGGTLRDEKSLTATTGDTNHVFQGALPLRWMEEGPAGGWDGSTDVTIEVKDIGVYSAITSMSYMGGASTRIRMYVEEHY